MSDMVPEIPHANRIIRDEASSMACMLDCSADETPAWRAEDLRSLLEHQMSVPLATDIVLPAAASWCGPSLASLTFGELLTQPEPFAPCLRLVKEFAKNLRRNAPGNAYPKELATVLYYASIAAARKHGEMGLSELDAPALTGGFTWALSRSWLTPELHALFADALEQTAQDPT